MKKEKIIKIAVGNIAIILGCYFLDFFQNISAKEILGLILILAAYNIMLLKNKNNTNS